MAKASNAWIVTIKETNRDLIDRYYQAFNDYDAKGVVALFENGGVYYDAFFDERCPYSELGTYFRAYLETEAELHTVNMVNECVFVNDNIAFTKYSVYQLSNSGTQQHIHDGIEFFHFGDGYIKRILDHYVMYDDGLLGQIAEQQRERYRTSKYAKSGLRMEQMARIRVQLNQQMNSEKAYLVPDLSLRSLAASMGVSPNHLSQVINAELQENFTAFIARYRVEHFKNILKSNPDTDRNIAELAKSSGFVSLASFHRHFKRLTGTTPRKYQNSLISPTDSNSD